MSDQLFYIFGAVEKNNTCCGKWITAQYITAGMYFLDGKHQTCRCLGIEWCDIVSTKAYKVFTTSPHNFFISEQELLAHNFLPFLGLGATFLFGGGLEFGGISLVASVASLVFGVTLFNKHAKRGGNFYVVPQNNGDNGGNNNKEPDDGNNGVIRICNTITKTEFFKKMKKQYEYWKDGIYKKKHNAEGIENAEFLKWDYKHGDVEAFGDHRGHLGSIDPVTLKIYKSAVVGRKIPKY